MPKPNKAMREEAQRGLDWRKEYGRGGTEVGVARASDIVNNRDLSMDTVRRMNSYFARHEVDKKGKGFSPGEEGYPSAGRIAWALWGGDAGQSWARQLSEKEDDRMASTAGEERHIKNIEETEIEVIVTFGKSDELLQGDEETAGYGKHKDKEKYREARPAAKLEVRALDDGGVTVEGYAAVFDQQTVIGGQWREQISPGAFRNAIDRDDVVFLINHTGLPLARTRSGTLELFEDQRGLKMRASLDMRDPDVRSIIPKMQRGDLDKMSFAFIPTRQKWKDVNGKNLPRRTIEEAELYDVSIVTTPAYSGTEIGLRSLEQFRNSQSWLFKRSTSMLKCADLT